MKKIGCPMPELQVSFRDHLGDIGNTDFIGVSTGWRVRQTETPSTLILSYEAVGPHPKWSSLRSVGKIASVPWTKA
jgi:hypothetical protein